MIRCLLTLLYSSRALSAGTVPDISSIRSPSSVTDVPDLTKYRKQFWVSLGYRRHVNVEPRGVHFKNYHMTSKSGPNGQALWTSMVDLKLIVESYPDLLLAIKEVGGPKLSKRLTILTSWLPHLPMCVFPKKGTTLRRLSYIPDKELKVRTVAILDYWSQTALRPLHDYLFKVLRKIPQDCTFEQGSFKEKVKDWKVFYSLDLSNATDRFPFIVISQLLEGLLPSSYVKSWCFIMCGLPFDFKHPKGTLEKVFYGVGNPMGAYTS